MNRHSTCARRTTVNIVMRLADPAFGNVRRSKPGIIRVLYAGRLHPEKSIYTILEMMHRYEMGVLDVHMSIVMVDQHTEEGRTIMRMLEGYKYAKLLDSRKTFVSMAGLLAETDMLLMPSAVAEAFGMFSVETQHSGCWVIASSLGGLPEANCGLLTLVEERNPQALIIAIRAVIALGLSTAKAHEVAVHEFTPGESVDSSPKVHPRESPAHG